MHQACFFQGTNYTGPRLCVNPGQVVYDVSVYRMNNTFSSVSIPLGTRVTVYQYTNLEGEFLDLTESVYDMSVYGDFWNNQISSIDFR
jgi:hypothetical protein